MAQTAPQPPAVPVDAPWVWSSADVAASDDWIWRLSPRSVDEIHAAVEGVRTRGMAFEDVRAADFPLPSLEDDFADMKRMLHDGRGFCLIKNVPVDGYDDDDLALIHWGVGMHLGQGLSQSYRGDKIGHVMDMTHTGDTRRPYRSPGALVMHVDPIDVVGLLCLRKARSGGESLVASSLAIYNTILAERPDLIPPLLEGYYYYHAEVEGTGGNPLSDHAVPVFGADCAGRLVCMYVPFTINRAIREKVVELTGRQQEALDFLNEVANRPDIVYEMDLEKGDIQYLNNRLILHGRRDYDDFEKIEEKRHMLRVWLRIDGWPDLPPVMRSRRMYDENGGVPVEAA